MEPSGGFASPSRGFRRRRRFGPGRGVRQGGQARLPEVEEPSRTPQGPVPHSADLRSARLRTRRSSSGAKASLSGMDNRGLVPLEGGAGANAAPEKEGRRRNEGGIGCSPASGEAPGSDAQRRTHSDSHATHGQERRAQHRTAAPNTQPRELSTERRHPTPSPESSAPREPAARSPPPSPQHRTAALNAAPLSATQRRPAAPSAARNPALTTARQHSASTTQPSAPSAPSITQRSQEHCGSADGTLPRSR